MFDVVQASSNREASVHALENAAKGRRAQGVYSLKKKKFNHYYGMLKITHVMRSIFDENSFLRSFF